MGVGSTTGRRLAVESRVKPANHGGTEGVGRSYVIASKDFFLLTAEPDLPGL